MTPFWRRRRDEDLEEEIRTHLAMAARDRVDRGEPPDAARAATHREFGNVALTKEITREMWGWRWLERLVQDLRYGVRMARRSPGLTAVAVLSLALGIGVNSAMFTVVESILLRPLPYAAPDRLIMVYSVGSFGPITFRDGNFTEADYVEMLKLDVFSQLAAYAAYPAAVTGGGEPVRVPRTQVTPTFFTALGVAPALGRAILPSDDATAETRAAVISDAFWRRRYQADPRVLGATTVVEGIPHVIVGVMPASFNFPPKTELWTPVQIRPTYRANTSVKLLGRLRDSVSPPQALAVLQTTLTNLARARSTTGRVVERERVSLVDLRDSLVGKVRRLLLVLLGAVGCVLLIACTNVANLLLARAASRGREMAIRTSLGAARGRLVRQLLTESVLLACAGGALGLVLAYVTLPAALSWLPPDVLPRTDEIQVNGAVLVFTFVLCVATGLVFGVSPALVSSRAQTIRSSHQRVDAGSPRDSRLRGGLVIAEVALVLVLLVCAGLLLKSVWKLQHVDPGFHPDGLVTMNIALPDRIYRTVEEKRAFYERLLDRMETVRGAADVSAVTFLPFGGLLVNGDFTIEGSERCKPPSLMVDKPSVSERYFKALGIPIVRGRPFEPRDTAAAPLVAIVSETVARTCWPGEEAIGKRLTMDDPSKGRWLTVVGVAADIRQADLSRSPVPAIYVPMRQESHSFFLNAMSFVSRSGPNISSELREAVRELDPSLPVGPMQMLDDRLAGSIAEPRLRAAMLLAFGALALALALVGIHGVMSYEVVRRTAEIGIRRALGAPTAAVLRLVIGRTMRLVALGAAGGVAGALAVTRVLRTFLFGVEPFDPATFASVAGALVAVAVVASAIPARRAALVDPTVALRSE